MLNTVKRCVIALAMAGVFLRLLLSTLTVPSYSWATVWALPQSQPLEFSKAQKSDKDSLSGSLSFESVSKNCAHQNRISRRSDTGFRRHNVIDHDRRKNEFWHDRCRFHVSARKLQCGH